MTIFNDVMVDIETTGHNVNRNAILQIAAVKFDYETEQVSDDLFDRCLHIPFGREWDFDTRGWWNKQGNVLSEIQSRAEDAYTVMQDFKAWLLKDWPSTREGVRFWGKPTHFDYAWMQSYFKHFQLDFPCHYRYARDLNSFMAGLGGSPEHPDYEGAPEGAEIAHNAIYDTIYQIQLLFHAKNATTQGVIIP